MICSLRQSWVDATRIMRLEGVRCVRMTACLMEAGRRNTLVLIRIRPDYQATTDLYHGVIPYCTALSFVLKRDRRLTADGMTQ